MTCIVGVEHEDNVYIGGDSAGVSGYSLTVRADSKVFNVGPYIMGFTSSFRMGQVLRYSLEIEEPSGDIERFMSTKFIDATRKALKDAGWLTTDDGRDRGGTFLVGISGQLFSVQSDFQVGRSISGYDAVGCGGDIAIGSLFTTGGQPPTERIMTALEAATLHSAGVTGPYKVLSSLDSVELAA